MSTLRTVFDVLPLLLLFAVGATLRRARVLDRGGAEGLKKVVVNVSLPVLLFDAFFRLKLETRNLALVAAVFGTCCLMALVGRAASRAAGLASPYASLLFEGFEAGMLGYGLFLGIAGDADLPAFAACDLGQVLFVFSVLQAQLLARRADAETPGGRIEAKALIVNFLKSPVVIAIIAGLAVGGAARSMDPSGAGAEATGLAVAAFWKLVGSLKSLTMPLICFVIGAGIEIDKEGIGFSLKVIAMRMSVLLVVAFVVGDLLAVRALGFPPVYRFAILALFLLPPPFVITVFMSSDDQKEYRRVSTALSAHSIVSVAAVAVAAVLR